MFHNTHLTRERHNAIIFQYPPPRSPRSLRSASSTSSLAPSSPNSTLSSPSTTSPTTNSKLAPPKSGYLADLMAGNLRKKPSGEKLYGRMGNASQEHVGAGGVQGIGKRFDNSEPTTPVGKLSFNHTK